MNIDDLKRQAETSLPLQLDSELCRRGIVHTGVYWTDTDASKPDMLLATFTTETQRDGAINRAAKIQCWLMAHDPRNRGSDEIPLELVDEADPHHEGWAVRRARTDAVVTPTDIAAWAWADTGRVRTAAFGIFQQAALSNQLDWCAYYRVQNTIYKRGTEYHRLSRVWVPASQVWIAMTDTIDQIHAETRRSGLKRANQ